MSSSSCSSPSSGTPPSQSIPSPEFPPTPCGSTYNSPTLHPAIPKFFLANPGRRIVHLGSSVEKSRPRVFFNPPPLCAAQQHKYLSEKGEVTCFTCLKSVISGSRPAWEGRRKQQQLFPEKELVVNGEKPEPQSSTSGKETDAAAGEEEDRSERETKRWVG